MSEQRPPFDGSSSSDPPAPSEPPAPLERQPPPARRPLVERLGMGAIALVLGALFGFVAVAAFSAGEPFLGVMGAIGCLMTLWVGGLTVLRG